MATIYYEKDAELEKIQKKVIAVIGYGSQGHAHALNMRDSGLDVVVGLRPESRFNEIAGKEKGIRVKTPADAAKEADIVMILAPDVAQKKIYDQDIESNLSAITICNRPLYRDFKPSILGVIMAAPDMLC